MDEFRKESGFQADIDRTETRERLRKSLEYTDPLPEEEPVEAEAEEQEEEELLPTGLRRLMMKQYIAAFISAIVTIVLIITYRTPQCLVGFVISGTLFYLASATKYDYKDGKIVELCLICASITPYKVRNYCRVVFRTQEEIPQYFEFILPGKKHDDFFMNHVYLVYFRENQPKTLMGYTQL